MTRTLKATKSQAKPTLGEFTETEAGVYQSVFTTGTQSGEATITVSVDGMSKTVTAELRATMMDVANSTLSANEPSGDVVADGQQAYTLTLTAVDSEGNPVTGEASRLRLVPQDTNGVTVGAISEIKQRGLQRHGFFDPCRKRCCTCLQRAVSTGHITTNAEVCCRAA